MITHGFRLLFLSSLISCFLNGFSTNFAEEPTRPLVAVGQFQVPPNLANDVTASTLTDLLRKFGAEGLRFKAVIASGDLERLFDFYRATGKLPKAADLKLTGADYTKLLQSTEFLLTPTVSKLIDKWMMTATLVNLHTGEAKTFSAEMQVNDTKTLDDLVKLLWRNVDSPLLLATLKHDNIVRSVSWSPDGKSLATGSEDDCAKVWTIDGRLKTTLRHRGQVSNVSWSPDGKLLVTTSEDKSAKVWDPNGKLVATLPHDDAAVSVSWSADGKHLATGSRDKTAKVWAPDGRLLVPLIHDQSVVSVHWSPFGNVLATVVWDKSSPAYLWLLEENPKTGAFRVSRKVDLSHDGMVSSLSWSSDGILLATGSWDKTAKIWNRDGSIKTILKVEAEVDRVSWSPDGKLLATLSRDNKVKLWTSNGTNMLTISGSRFSWSQKGELLAIGSNGSCFEIWTYDGIFKATMKIDDWVNLLSWSPDEELLATSSYGRMPQIWRIRLKR